MASCTGIIAEYNPFHNGHLYQLERARASNPGARIAVAMSGSFTQRGEPACADKFTRARWALEQGADIVFELPSVFVLASAERFARGGVALLAGSGIVDALSFGAEDADAVLLRRLARMSCPESGALGERLAVHLKAGSSFPAARAKACADLHGGALSGALTSPNNILALEYLRAIDAFSPDMQPLPVKREGVGHDETSPAGNFASASALRAAFARGERELLSRCAPEAIAADAARLVGERRMPCTAEALSDIFLYALRKLSLNELASLPDVTEGLENVLYREARNAATYSSFLAAVKSKRYTAARLRRIPACAMLGITKDVQRAFPLPLYLRVLGVRRESAGLLSTLSQKASLPVLTCKADHDALGADARAMLSIDLLAAEILALASPSPQPAPYEFARALLMV